MAIIIKGSASVLLPQGNIPVPNYDFEDMEGLVESYWNGDLTTERMFPIPFWQIMQFFAASPNDEVALKVSNIETPAYVDATWMPFDDNLEELLQDPVQASERYYVLEQATFNGPIVLSNGTSVNGIRDRILSAGIAHRAIIWARIGKEVVNGEIKYYVFFNAADCSLLDSTGSGEGTGAGIKIPSQ